jgi:hypothetical protein
MAWFGSSSGGGVSARGCAVRRMPPVAEAEVLLGGAVLRKWKTECLFRMIVDDASRPRASAGGRLARPCGAACPSEPAPTHLDRCAPPPDWRWLDPVSNGTTHQFSGTRGRASRKKGNARTVHVPRPSWARESGGPRHRNAARGWWTRSSRRIGPSKALRTEKAAAEVVGRGARKRRPAAVRMYFDGGRCFEALCNLATITSTTSYSPMAISTLCFSRRTESLYHSKSVTCA